MKALKVLAALLVIIAASLLGFYAYLGGFHSVEVKLSSFGGQKIIFTTYVGPYEKIGSAWEQFVGSLKDLGVESCSALAIYLDPPDTPPDKKRSVLACDLSAIAENRHKQLRSIYGYFEIPESQALYSEFPFVNTISFMLGPMRVYPKLQEYIKQHSLEAVFAAEVYGVEGEFDKIQVFMPYNVNKWPYQKLYDAFDRH